MGAFAFGFGTFLLHCFWKQHSSEKYQIQTVPHLTCVSQGIVPSRLAFGAVFEAAAPNLFLYLTPDDGQICVAWHKQPSRPKGLIRLPDCRCLTSGGESEDEGIVPEAAGRGRDLKAVPMG